MADESDKQKQASTKQPRDRSPAYPFISLRGAVERLAAFEAMFGRHPAPADKAGLAWKMKEKSSQAFQTLAALKSYGLIDYKGSNADRVAILTDDGRNYLRAQQESIRAEILRRCALRPKAIMTYWNTWGADRPIDAICLDELVIKASFTESAAATFLRVYDDTVAFAGLSNGDTMQSQEEASTASEEEPQMQQVAAPPVNPAVPTTFRQTTQPQAAIGPVAGFVDESYPLDGGRAFVVRRPEVFSAAELEEFDAWVTLLQRKMKRLVQQ